jgi:hypothetical protein
MNEEEPSIKIPIFFLVVILIVNIIGYACKADASEMDDTIWLARSCVGEAGWSSHKTGECSAILHVYKKISDRTGVPLIDVARKYSSAIKWYPGKPNKWVIHLNGPGKKPRKWPANLKWSKYKKSWLSTVEHVKMFLSGKVEDPLPNADHYGCGLEHWRAEREGWTELKTNFRNRFYSVR